MPVDSHTQNSQSEQIFCEQSASQYVDSRRSLPNDQPIHHPVIGQRHISEWRREPSEESEFPIQSTAPSVNSPVQPSVSRSAHTLGISHGRRSVHHSVHQARYSELRPHGFVDSDPVDLHDSSTLRYHNPVGTQRLFHQLKKLIIDHIRPGIDGPGNPQVST